MINGGLLRDAVISAAHSISNKKKSVDELNVFPVPDGDTGTNMSMTITNSVAELENLSDDTDCSVVASTTASALLRGARGNSGVILSLIFRGFAKGLAGKKGHQFCRVPRHSGRPAGACDRRKSCLLW